MSSRCIPRKLLLTQKKLQACCASRQTFSSKQNTPSTTTIIHRLGDVPYGTRQYVLMSHDQQQSSSLAILHAHRNILFGASGDLDLCDSLVKAALTDASAQGEQPQAMATLHGLCKWVSNELLVSQDNNSILQSLDPIALQAVQAVATHTPRPGHTVMGEGTLRDASEAWEQLATAFVQAKLSHEANLYMRHQAEFVGIELQADRSPSYLISAGGAMARLFFV